MNLFYPYTLKSQWYMVDVCKSIVASLEGAKKWGSYYYENDCEKKAWLETFEVCQRIVWQNSLKPDDMLQALSDFHTDITTTRIVEPFFSAARWIYDPNSAREEAVTTAFNLVDGISKRFLW